MEVTDHLDLEKVMHQQTEKLLKIARLQGHWTATKSLQRQAESLKTEGPIMEQFKVHIKYIEQQLQSLGANISEQR